MIRPLSPCSAALIAFAFACGCTKDSAKKPDPVAPPDNLGIPVPATDSTWALAPANTQIALVVGEGTGEHLLAAVEELERTMKAHPVGARLWQEMLDDMPDDMPENLLERSYHKQVGLDLSRPAAVFMTPDEELLVVLPVIDRAAFRALAEGTLDEATDTDMFEDDVRCKEMSGAYVCAKTDQMLASVGQGKSLARKVTELDEDLRGHVEIYVDGSAMRDEADPEVVAVLGEVEGVHGALQLERGGFNARMRIATRPRHPAIAAASRVSNQIAERVAKEQPAGFVRLRVPLAEVIPPEAAAQLAPAAAFAKLDAKADILDNLTGEVLMYGVAQKGIGMIIEIGAKDGKRLRPAIDFLCEQATSQLPAMAREFVEISAKQGRCEVELDPTKLGPLAPPNMPLTGPIEVALYTTADSVAMSMSAKTKHQSGPVAAGPVGRDLLTGSWNLALWGYGSFASMMDPSFLQTIRELPTMQGDELEKVLFGIWLLSHLSEMGMGAGVRDDGVHLGMRVGTQWANEEPVLREYQEQLVELLAGDASASDRLAALAKKSPESPFGRSHRAGAGGGPMITIAAVGVLAAAAIPAFLRYQQRSREIEGAYKALEAYEDDVPEARAYDDAGESEDQVPDL